MWQIHVQKLFRAIKKYSLWSTVDFTRRVSKITGDLRDALEKLQLNDASLFYQPETSVALGFGFRCGFLGLLHLEIIQERLEREYNLDLVTTAPGVIYKVYKTNGDMIELTNPSNLPDPSEIEYMEEPMVNAEIMVTTEFIGAIMDLCQERRGQYIGMDYMEETRALLKYKLPLNEIIYDFFDALKSRSRGYASLDYDLCGYERSELVKLDILVNKEEVDALSFIVHAETAYQRGRKMCEKLKEEIPRQLFEIPIQAAVGSKIIARETVRAMRKDVLAKCYGGDISRKKKLLEKQKEGKKRMRQVGNVEIPQKAFMSVLKLDKSKQSLMDKEGKKMKKITAKKITVLSVLFLCVFLSGCGCGKKKKDPAGEQVLKISITPEPSPTPKPEEVNQDAVVTNGNITMVNEYLTKQGRSTDEE